MMLLDTPPAERHSFWEDLLGIATGAVLVALSIQILRASGLFTGQIAGLALVVSPVSGWGFGALFFVFNLPFYLLAIRQLGWIFTIKSFGAVALMSLLVELLPAVIPLTDVPAFAGAVLAGVLAGVGLLSLFRHGATLGGVGIVALWLQDTKGIKAGHVQLGFDLLVFGTALWLFDWQIVFWSLVGAFVLNVIIIVNHRRDRYIARS